MEDILVVYDDTLLPEPYTHKPPGKAAPEVFGNLSRELESLHCVLGEAADSLSSHPLPPRRKARLQTILHGCISVLADLQFIVQKYQSLGTDDKGSWDRLRLGGEDIAEIRSRLVFNITLLTAFRRFFFLANLPIDFTDDLTPVLSLEPQRLKHHPYQRQSSSLGSGWSSSQGRRELQTLGFRSCPLSPTGASPGRKAMPQRS